MALAAAAGALWAYSHEIAQTAHSLLRWLGLASMAIPPAAKRAEDADLVDASAFAPTNARAGEDVLVQIFLHALDKRKAAATLAREADVSARRRGIATLAAPVSRGQRVDILLEARGCAIDEARPTT